ncbi:DUF2267 domain-containing protein [Actinomadura sp. SCN-SB]|uniref:DUF2267 domain-containing protein n=1 Tax=Actinomadura sp. SCN-SB TaxID=3373092 RepID=UPI00375011B4
MTVRYQELLESVSRKADLDTADAREAAEATVTTLARTLPHPERDQFMDVLPGELRRDVPERDPVRRLDQREFVQEVSALEDRPPEQARVRAQAVLSTLADQEPGLIEDLHVPEDLRELFDPPPAGGGLTAPGGGMPPLTEDEVREALHDLPQWTGDTRELRRTIVLPPGDLDRVLERIRLLKEETLHGPQIRRGADGVQLALSTSSVGRVTALDVDMAARLNELIDEVAPGMAAPPS